MPDENIDPAAPEEGEATSASPTDSEAKAGAVTDTAGGAVGLLAAQIVAVVVGLGLLVWAVIGYAAASGDGEDRLERASVRDAVLVQATDALEILNTMDRRDVDAGLAAWSEVSAGALRKELTDLTPKQRKAFAAVAQISTATVPAIAVTRVDADAGTASVIAYVEKQVANTEKKVRTAAATRIQFTADLRRQGNDWLVTSLTPVAVVTPEGGRK